MTNKEKIAMLEKQVEHLTKENIKLQNKLELNNNFNISNHLTEATTYFQTVLKDAEQLEKEYQKLNQEFCAIKKKYQIEMKEISNQIKLEE